VNKFIKKAIFLSVFLVILFVPLLMTNTAIANEHEEGNTITYVPLAPLPGVSTGEDLGTYLQDIFNFTIGVAAILAVFMIALGGAWYIGSDSITGKSDGKEFISNAVQGLILALVAWLILYTINPNLLNLNFNPSESAPAPVETEGGEGGEGEGNDDGGGDDVE